MTQRKLRAADVVISVEPLPEDVSPRDSYAVPGVIDRNSDDTNRFVADVESMITMYGLWGWCRVEVRVRFGPMVGVAHRGGCSYANEKEFRHPDGYFPQLVTEAIADLEAQLAELDILRRKLGMNAAC
jgi:hypothetical protein